MTIKSSSKPWHEVVQLRDDLKTGELSLAVFAADLYDVIIQKGQRPVYEHPAEFFALTYPTYNLRELVKDVALRLGIVNRRKADDCVDSPREFQELRRRDSVARRSRSHRSTSAAYPAG